MPSPAEQFDPIIATMSTLFGRLKATNQLIARGYGITAPTAIALANIDDAITMRQLADRLGHERSFVTAIADELEGQGLLRRTSDERDRRVKLLVLTRKGKSARRRYIAELAGNLRWHEALTDTERATLLTLLTKLQATPPPD